MSYPGWLILGFQCRLALELASSALNGYGGK